jgi:uncharacterized phage protein (TIGR02218 family)
MKNAPIELVAYLNTSHQFRVVDLYTFSIKQVRTTVEGDGIEVYYNTYRYASSDIPVQYGGDIWSATGLLINRDRVTSTLGLEVSSVKLSVYATDTMTVESLPFMTAAATGILDGALVQIDRAFLNDYNEVIGAPVNNFTGMISQVEVSRSVATMNVHSITELLNIQLPRTVYQTTCQHTLYNSQCGVARYNYMQTCTVNTASLNTIVPVTLTPPDGYFDLGAIVFTSGVLNGELRTVKSWASGVIKLVSPLPVAPQFGDEFAIYPGCDKTKATCASRFNNLDSFKGFPYVPVPETMR